MNEHHPSFQECRSYVAAHLHTKPKLGITQRPPAITLSRQTGARGQTIGQKLQNALRSRNPKDPVPWTIFDKNLVQKILEDHNLPTDLEKFMPDNAVSELEGSINEILGRHPSLWTLFEHTVETIARLSRMGNCIIVGRGANMITRGFPNVLQVRLIGSKDVRIRRMTTAHGMPLKEAQQFIHNEDTARRKYMKQHFNCNIDDPTLYDLTVKTDSLSDEAIVDLLIAAIEAK